MVAGIVVGDSGYTLEQPAGHQASPSNSARAQTGSKESGVGILGVKGNALEVIVRCTPLKCHNQAKYWVASLKPIHNFISKVQASTEKLPLRPALQP